MSVHPAQAEFENIFNQIYEAHRAAIYAYLFGRIHHREGAQDLLQETFTRAWLHVEKLAEMEEGQQRFWLFSIAKNLSIDYHRRTQRWQTATERLANSSSSMSSGVAELREQLLVLDEAIEKLPETLRVVLSLHVLGGMNSKEIGRLLDVPAGTIRYQLSQARKRLAAEVKHHE